MWLEGIRWILFVSLWIAVGIPSMHLMQKYHFNFYILYIFLLTGASIVVFWLTAKAENRSDGQDSISTEAPKDGDFSMPAK